MVISKCEANLRVNGINYTYISFAFVLFQIVKHLLQLKYADVNAKNSAGYSPVLLAAIRGHVDVLSILLKQLTAGEGMWATVEMSEVFIQSVKSGHENVMDLLLGKREYRVYLGKGTLSQALIAAAEQGHLGIMGTVLCIIHYQHEFR
jgi:ankyrin repeat protein